MSSLLFQSPRVSHEYNPGASKVPSCALELFVRTVKFAYQPSSLGMLEFRHWYTPLATIRKSSSFGVCGDNIMQLQLKLTNVLVPGNRASCSGGPNFVVGFLLGCAGG